MSEDEIDKMKKKLRMKMQGFKRKFEQENSLVFWMNQHQKIAGNDFSPSSHEIKEHLKPFCNLIFNSDFYDFYDFLISFNSQQKLQNNFFHGRTRF